MGNHDYTIGSIFRVVITRELLDRLKFLIYEVENINHGLKIEPNLADLHITLLIGYGHVPFPFRQEMASQIHKLSPSKVLPTPTKLELFGQDKDTLVILMSCPELEECNRKLVKLAESRGIDTSQYEYRPHMTIGKVNKSNIHLPEIEEFPVYVKSLIFKGDDDYSF